MSCRVYCKTAYFFVDGSLLSRNGLSLGFVAPERRAYYIMVELRKNWCESRSENMRKCNHCDRLSANPNTARAHESNHWFVRVCFCGSSFRSVDALQKHKRGAVDNRRQHNYGECPTNARVQELLGLGASWRTPRLTADIEGWSRLRGFLQSFSAEFELENLRDFPVNTLHSRENNVESPSIEFIPDNVG